MAKPSEENARREDNHAKWVNPDNEGHTPAMADADQQRVAPEEGAPVPAIADVTKENVHGTIEGEDTKDLAGRVIHFEKKVLDEAINNANPDARVLGKALKARTEAAVKLAAKNAAKIQKISNFWDRQILRLRKGGRGIGKGAVEVAGGLWDFSWELLGRAFHGVIRGFKKGKKKTDDQLKDSNNG
jgi:hypothetical protein